MIRVTCMSNDRFTLLCRAQRCRHARRVNVVTVYNEVRGGVDPWLMARWKARVRLPIRQN